MDHFDVKDERLIGVTTNAIAYYVETHINGRTPDNTTLEISGEQVTQYRHVAKIVLEHIEGYLNGEY